MNIHSRNLSLDVFRGLTVCFMIIVNTAGSWNYVYAPLRHADWHGFTPTDLVFPSFLFAVGNAIFFGMKIMRTLSPAAVYTRIFKRTIIIFLLGFLMYWFPFVHHTDTGLVFNPLGQTRIMGVLQRIAICYGLASVLIYRIPWKTILWISISILLAYWVLMAWGGDYSMLANLGQIIDVKVLGSNHLYHGEGVAFDPEGILSTLPSVANVLLGYLTAHYLQESGSNIKSVFRLAALGGVLILVSLLWNEYFPINKKLWTSSFVLHTVGWDLILISLLVYIIDEMKIVRWTSFFHIFGRNPLIIYLFSEVLAILLNFFRTKSGVSWYDSIYLSVFQPLGNFFGSFVFAVSFMMVCWLVGWYLDKRKIYIRV